VVGAPRAPLRIATRGSELALWQARWVRDAIRTAGGAEPEIVTVRTTGDRIQDVPLAKIGDKGLFTKELDAALLAGDAELAVHSLKDVPTRLPEGLEIVAVCAREDPRDVLLLRPGLRGGLAELAAGARVGTSSLRRRAQLRAVRRDVQVLDLRGNLNTRLARLDAGDYEGIVLAAAGVHRLGWGDRVAEYVTADGWLPAVGQGALAIVARAGDGRTAAVLAGLHDPATGAATTAERALLRALEGGCQIPIGALAEVSADGRLTLRGLVADLDGDPVLRVEETGSVDDAAAIGRRAADALLAQGAGEVLARIRAGIAAPQPAAP
jgi:hydroxymethylbilane synthase